MLELLALVVIAAAVVEFLTEGLKAVLPKVAGWLFSLAISLVLCLSAQLTLLGILGFKMLPVIDSILTALIISRGSSALHEFLKKIGVVKSEAAAGGSK